MMVLQLLPLIQLRIIQLVFLGAHPGVFGEDMGEIGRGLDADGFGDFEDFAGRVAQQLLGHFNPVFIDDVDDGLAGHFFVQAAEVAAVDVNMVGNDLQIQVLVVMLPYIFLAFDDDVIRLVVILRNGLRAALYESHEDICEQLNALALLNLLVHRRLVLIHLRFEGLAGTQQAEAVGRDKQASYFYILNRLLVAPVALEQLIQLLDRLIALSLLQIFGNLLGSMMGRSTGSKGLARMRHIHGDIIIVIKAALQRLAGLLVSCGQGQHIPVQQADTDIDMVLPEVLRHGQNFIADREQGLGGDGCIAAAHGDNRQKSVFLHIQNIKGRSANASVRNWRMEARNR